MEIYLSVNNREEIFQLPVLPPSFTVSKPQTTEKFETVSGSELQLIGAPKLKSIEISSFFPIKGHDYSYLKNRDMWGWDYVNKLDDWIERKLPIRLIISPTPINMAVAVKDFKYTIKSDGDLWYTLSLEEFNLLEDKVSDTGEEELTMSQYEELKQSIDGLTEVLNDLAHPRVYNSVSDVPDWARTAVDKLVKTGVLSGDDGNLSLSYDILRMITLLDRLDLI